MAKAPATKAAPPAKQTKGMSVREKALQSYIIDQKALVSRVKKEMILGVHYGPAYEGSPKKNIYKAGCEVVKTWLNLVDKPFVDQETALSQGNPQGVFFYVCYLIPVSQLDVLHQRIIEVGVANKQTIYEEMAVATGFGAADIKEGQIKKHNTAVKKGRKRAFMDAILNLGLSGEFVQDFEDYTDIPPEHEEVPTRNVTPKKEPATVASIHAALVDAVTKGGFTPAQTTMFLKKADEWKEKDSIKNLQALFESVKTMARGNRNG